MYYSQETIEKVLEEFHQKIRNEQEIDPKIMEVVNENFLDFLESTDEKEE